MTWRVPGIAGVDVVLPLFQARTARGRRRVTVGDIVDRPAKRVNFKHGLPLRSRQDAHGRIERTAGCRQRRVALDSGYGDGFRNRHRSSRCEVECSIREHAEYQERGESLIRLTEHCLPVDCAAQQRDRALNFIIAPQPRAAIRMKLREVPDTPRCSKWIPWCSGCPVTPVSNHEMRRLRIEAPAFARHGTIRPDRAQGS